jgi:hypothetical protein
MPIYIFLARNLSSADSESGIFSPFFLTNSASVLFTDYDIIWFQIHEMLRIEKGGDEQITDELHAYESLVRKFPSFFFLRSMI